MVDHKVWLIRFIGAVQASDLKSCSQLGTQSTGGACELCEKFAFDTSLRILHLHLD